MRNLLALSAAVALAFLGLGWYLGWYQFKSTTSQDGHRQISLDLDTNRIKTDVANKIRDVLDKDGIPIVATPGTPGTTTTPVRAVPGISTGFRPDEGSFVYPGEPFTPVPPGSGPRLPAPR